MEKEKETITIRDNRAISNKFLDVLNGDLKCIPDAVRSTDSNLELCFRGNDGDCIIIYYNNNKVIQLSLEPNGKLKILLSLAHLRYNGKTERDVINDLKKLKYIKNNRTSLPNDYNISRTFTIEDAKIILPGIISYMKSMIIEYFNNIGKREIIHDYFNECRNKPRTDYKPHFKLEKIRQQEIMRNLHNIQDGYFIYDLEFAEPHIDNAAKKSDHNKNQPDILGLHFENGKPKSLAIIEVKSTEGAITGNSGISEHLEVMKKYRDDSDFRYKKFRENRRTEAKEIFNLYKKLKLRGLSESAPQLNDDIMKDLAIELLFIFTDGVEKIVFNSLTTSEQKDLSKNAIITIWSSKTGLTTYVPQKN